MAGRKEENSELEEGEACSYSKEDYDENIDIDVSLSYIDEKLQSVLGHFQKDFEGGVSAETLGAKYGGYGSFLPARERSPSIFSRPKTPEMRSGPSKSPCNFPVEGVVKNFVVPSISTLSPRANASHNSGKLVGNLLVKQESGSAAAPVVQKSNLKSETLHKPSNLSAHRPLKVRIKVGPDKNVRTNSAIYSGLGLDNSPSSSMGNSLDGSGGTRAVADTLADESPASILQAMTSFVIPGGIPLSPLQERLLCLSRKDKLAANGKPVKRLQEPLSLSAQELVAVLDREKLPEEEVKLADSDRKLHELRQRCAANSKSGAELSSKKKLGIAYLEGKHVPPGIMKSTIPSNSEPVTDFMRVNGGTSEVSRGASDDGGGERSSSSNIGKEDSSESKSGHASAKAERRQSSSVEKLSSNRALMSEKNDFLGPKGSSRVKNAKISAPSKVYIDAFGWKDDMDIDTASGSEGKVDQRASFDGQVETAFPSVKDKLAVRVKKKMKGIGNSKKEFDVSTVDTSRFDLSIATKDTNSEIYDPSNLSSKRQKLNSQKDFNKVRGNNQRAAKRPVGHRSKDPTPDDNLESGQVVALNKSNDKFHGKAIDKLQMPARSCARQNAVASEIAPPDAEHVLIEEQWVACDSCEKWRLLPNGTNSDQLPEKWVCSMQNWLPGMNSCNVSENETTASIRNWYKIQHDVVPTYPQNTSGTVSGATPSHVQHSGQNHRDPSSHTASSGKNKKYTMDETGKAGLGRGFVHSSNLANNHSHKLVKSKTINAVNQLPVKPNPVDRSGLLSKSKLHILDAKKHIARHKEDDINGGSFSQGEGKQTNVKNREADNDARRTSKKARIGDSDHVAVQEHSDIDLEKIGRSSKFDSFTKSGAKSIQNSLKDGKSNAKERLLVSIKLGEEAVVSSGGSLDLRMADERGKKRKSREWKESQNGLESAETRLKKDRKSRGLQSVNEGKRSLKHSRKSASQQTVDGVDSLKKDFVVQHASVTATSSSSKVSVSFKARPVVDDVKGSPVESVSSSPLRPKDTEKFPSGNLCVTEKEGPKNGGVPAGGDPRSSWDEVGPTDRNHSVKARKEKTLFHLHRSCDSEYWGVAADKTAGKRSKPFPDALNGDVETPEHDSRDRRVTTTHHVNSMSEIDVSNAKVLNPVGENADLHAKKMTSPVSKTRPKALLSSVKRLNDRKHNIPDKTSPKSWNGEKDQITGVSADEKLENQVRLESYEGSHQKARVPCNNKNDTSIQNDLNLDSWGKVKVDAAKTNRHSGPSKLLPDSEAGKLESGIALAVSHQGHPLNGEKLDLSQVRQAENAVNKSGPRQSWGHRAPGLVDSKELSDPSPGRATSSCQRAADVLKEAQTLRDRADHFKDSGFGFESNEVYFEAALKFLHGGSLFETSSSEIGRQGEMTQMQVYSTAAKLCECCAVEYERRQDMAAAALAYKCMEVAYWRVVYCKNSSSSRDRTELQASLQLIAQGDSPSSSASDVDNLNNQGTVDKAIVTKGAVSHVAGNPAIAARNYSHFLRLLDFTQDVNFAMEASRKSQSSLLAADIVAEKAQNREYLSSVKKVIDFSFQDVDGLINLVQLAMRAVSRSGLGVVRG